jgi:two-component system, cell cycle response regulator CpdR
MLRSGHFTDDAPKQAGEFMARILLAEDEEALRRFVSRALKLDGHDVVEACDGAQGLDCLRNGTGYDLILSDIRMPVLDGIALAHAAAEEFPATRILLMTGFAEQRERAESLSRIVHDIVPKPFSLPDIRGAVAQALNA